MALSAACASSSKYMSRGNNGQPYRGQPLPGDRGTLSVRLVEEEEEELPSAAPPLIAGMFISISDASVIRGMAQYAAIEAAKKRVIFVPLGLNILMLDRLLVIRRSAERR